MDIYSYEPESETHNLSQKTHSLKKKPCCKNVTISKLSVISRTTKEGFYPGLEAEVQLVTGATDGPVKAILTEDIESFGEVFAREGATFLGTGSSSEHRLIITFQKIVEEGKVRNIRANAYDMKDKTLGLRGKKISRRIWKYLAAASLHFIGGISEGLQEREVQGNLEIQKPSLKNALFQGAGNAALGQSKEVIESLKNKQNFIHVRPGTKCLIVFEGQP